MSKRTLESMATKKQWRMLFWLSYPVILSLFVQSLYSLVDSIFLSRLGEETLSAVSLAFSFQSLCTAFFTGIATGINALVSKAIGEKNMYKAREVVVNGIVVQLILCFIIALVGIFALKSYFSASTTNESVIQLGYSYLQPLLIFSFCSSLQITFERLLQSSGKAKYMLYSQVVGTLVNCILDPLLIFGLLFFPQMGILGAAVATLIGQASAVALALYFNIKKNSEIFSEITSNLRVRPGCMGKICSIGLPSATLGVAGSIGNYYMNIVLIDYMSTANASFGIYTKLQDVATMPLQGIGAGLVTQTAFFYGQRDFVKMKRTLFSGVILMNGWSFLCFLAFFFFPQLLMQPFSPTESMIRIGVPCFRIIGTTYLILGMFMALNYFCQAVGKSLFMIVVSLARHILVRIPAAALLARLGNIDLIWWCWPISEVASDTVTLIVFIYVFAKLKREMPTNKKWVNGELG